MNKIANLMVCGLLGMGGCKPDGNVIFQDGMGGATGSSTASGADGGGGGGTGTMSGSTGTGGNGGGQPSAARLVVAVNGQHSLFWWDDADTLTSDVGPNGWLDVPSAGSTTALGATSDALYVTTDKADAALVAYGAPGKLAKGEAPGALIPEAAFPQSAALGAATIVLASDGGPVIAKYANGAHLFPDGALKSSSTPSAYFTYKGYQSEGIAWDAGADRLFLGHIQGGGISAWNNASSRTGTPPPDFAVSDDAIWSMAIGGDRLFGGGSLGTPTPAPGIGVWQLSSLSGPAAPSLVLGGASGIEPGMFVRRVIVANDVLVACVQAFSKGHRVLVWDHASTLAAGALPTQTITVSSEPLRAALSADGRLFVLSTDAIAIYDDATMNPTLVTTLTGQGEIGSFSDLLLAE